jgi:hypothetical protein
MPVQTQMQVRRGTASSWTSTNPTLAAGELGFETDTGKFKIGTGSSTWTALSYAGGGQNTLTTYQYTATAGQTTFSGADANGNTLSYTAGAVQVYLNGALLANTTDYAASNGTSVVLTGGAGLSDSLTILSLGSFTVSTDIPKSTLTAKGSIVAASGAATPANLSVGANDTVLTADSTTATGLKWAAPAAGGSNFVALNGAGTTLSGSSTSITGLSGYDKYYVYIYNMSGSTGTPGFNMTFNSDTSSKYGGDALQLNANSTAINIVGITFTDINGDTSFPLGFAAAASSLNATMMITGGNSSGAKIVERQAGVGSTSGNSVLIQTGIYTGTSVISSIQITCSTGTFDAGKVYIYGSA